jgi:hypothetical protein
MEAVEQKKIITFYLLLLFYLASLLFYAVAQTFAVCAAREEKHEAVVSSIRHFSLDMISEIPLEYKDEWKTLVEKDPEFAAVCRLNSGWTSKESFYRISQSKNDDFVYDLGNIIPVSILY